MTCPAPLMHRSPTGQSPAGREIRVRTVTTTPPVVPERSPPDVTAAVVAITDQARAEIRRLAAAVLVAVVLVGAALVWQLERIRETLIAGR